MKMSAALAVSALAALVAVPLAAAPRKPVRHATRSAAPVAWTARVAMTAEGGFLVGNPAANVKLVEYGSISCPTCRAFHLTAMASVRARVAAGTTSYEFRPFAVHSIDPMLHALLLCAGPRQYVRFADDFYADQPALMAAYETWSEANPKTNPNAGAETRVTLARQWGLTAFAAKHGLTAAATTRCLSNTAAFVAQQGHEDKAAKRGVAGTPTFYLNDQPLAVEYWPDVDAAIGAALGS